LASTLAALKSLNSLQKLVRKRMTCLLSIISVVILIRVQTKDKQTEYEARRLITQAHERGNVSVRKVVDYTRQQIGYKFNACKTTKRAHTSKNHTFILYKTIASSTELM
jgi:hypothetical protein